MVTRAQAFPSKYFTAADIVSTGPKLVVVDRIGPEMVGTEEKQEKYVAYFQGEEKGLVLNATKWSVMESLYGEESDGWIGKEIVMFPDKTRFGGKIVDCISLRARRYPQADNGRKQAVQKRGYELMSKAAVAPPQPMLDPDIDDAGEEIPF